jgi:hypothetical protein
VRLIWLVIGKFRQNLKIKKQREELLRKKQRRNNKNKKRRKGNTLKKNASLKASSYNSPQNIQSIVKTDENSNAANSKNINSSDPVPIESSRQNTLKSKNPEMLTRTEIKDILLSTERSVTSNLVINDNQLFLDPAGILTVSKFMKSSKTKQPNNPNSHLQLMKNLNISNASLNSSISSKKITFLNEIKKESSASLKNPVQVTQDDPLGAFSQDREATPSTITNSITTVNNNKQASTNKILNNFDDIKRRLFDYKPFADQTKTSDFLYERKVEPEKVMKQQRRQPEVEDSYDSDLYTDSEDESFENGSRSLENESDFYDDEVNGEGDLSEGEYNEEDIEEEDDLENESSDNSFTKRGGNTNGKRTTTNMNNSSQDSHLDAYGSENGDAKRNTTASRTTIDIENISVSSGSNLRNVTSNSSAKSTSSPFSSPFSKLISSSKMFSLVESSASKLKGVTQFITEKSTEIKDVIMSNSNQQDLSDKLRTFSNYQVNTPTYLNDFIKSKTSLTGLSGAASASTAMNGTKKNAYQSSAPERSNAYGLMPSTQQIDYALEHNVAFESKFDLEQIPSDETFKPLPMSWWDIEKDSQAGSNFQASFKQIYVDVQISSCN